MRAATNGEPWNSPSPSTGPDLSGSSTKILSRGRGTVWSNGLGSCEDRNAGGAYNGIGTSKLNHCGTAPCDQCLKASLVWAISVIPVHSDVAPRSACHERFGLWRCNQSRLLLICGVSVLESAL